MIWIAHGVILSGYPLYPSAVAGLPVDWRIPREELLQTVGFIRGFARRPEVHWTEVLQDWGWLKPWSLRALGQRTEVGIPLVLLLYGGIRRILRPSRSPGEPRALIALFFGMTALAMIYWFLTAPDPRFLGATLWVMGAGSVVLASSSLQVEAPRIEGHRPGPEPAGRPPSPDANPMTGLGRRWVLPLGATAAFALVALLYPRTLFWGPGADGGFHSTPEAQLETFETRSGLVVHVATERGGRCLDAPLPCTLVREPDLCLRVEGDLGGGFRICEAGNNGPRPDSAVPAETPPS